MIFSVPLAPTLTLPRKQGRERGSFPRLRRKVGAIACASPVGKRGSFPRLRGKVGMGGQT